MEINDQNHQSYAKEDNNFEFVGKQVQYRNQAQRKPPCVGVNKELQQLQNHRHIECIATGFGFEFVFDQQSQQADIILRSIVNKTHQSNSNVRNRSLPTKHKDDGLDEFALDCLLGDERCFI